MSSKDQKPTYFDILLEWNSGDIESFKCPVEFKKKFQKAVIQTEDELEYLERRYEKENNNE